CANRTRPSPLVPIHRFRSLSSRITLIGSRLSAGQVFVLPVPSENSKRDSLVAIQSDPCESAYKAKTALARPFNRAEVSTLPLYMRFKPLAVPTKIPP